MNPRERTLAILLVGFIVLGGGGFIAYTFILGPIRTQDKAILALRDDIKKKEDRRDLIAFQREDYNKYRQMSLPQDVDLSRREYEMLISGMLRQSQFAVNTIAVTARPVDTKSAPTIDRKKPAYSKLSFVVTAKGDEASLIDFLERFYKQPLLHQIRNLNLTRTTRADGRTRNELDITMTVETVVLGDAENRATLLPVSPGIALVAGSAIAFRSEVNAVESGKGSPTVYQEAVVFAETREGEAPATKRNYPAVAGKNVFFGPTVVEKAVVESVPREADFAPYIRLTSITHETDGRVRAELFDFFNKHEYQATIRADGSLNVDMFYFLGDRRKRDGDHSGRDLYVGSEETGNFRRYQIVAMSGDDLVIQTPDDVRDVNLRFGGSLVAGGGVPALLPGKCYVWHVGQVLKEALANPMTSGEARQAVLNHGGIAPPKREGR